MRPRVPLVVLALIALALAGCTAPPPAPGPGPAEDAPPEEARLLTPQELANATAGEDQPQGEFAMALEERFHTHEYWNGLMEKTLMDADVASAPLLPFNANDPFTALGRAFGFGFGFGGGLGSTAFEMPEGSIIPPETERVEVSVTWPSSNTITGLQLLYMSAASKDVEGLDPFPEGGGTVVIPTNLTMNDMPHTTVSKWRWFLRPDNPTGGPGVFNGTAHVVIKAFRNNTLFLAPPHPDAWGANTTLPILQVNGTLSCARAVFPLFLDFIPGAPAGCEEGFVFLELPNGTIVPPHTGLLTAELAWQNTPTAPDPFATRPHLVYTPANTRRFIAPEGEVAENGRAVYTIAVDPKMVDSPYANVSEWGFFLFLRSTAPTDNGFFGGIGDFEGAFTLSIVAERETLAA